MNKVLSLLKKYQAEAVTLAVTALLVLDFALLCQVVQVPWVQFTAALLVPVVALMALMNSGLEREAPSDSLIYVWVACMMALMIGLMWNGYPANWMYIVIIAENIIVCLIGLLIVGSAALSGFDLSEY